MLLTFWEHLLSMNTTRLMGILTSQEASLGNLTKAQYCLLCSRGAPTSWKFIINAYGLMMYMTCLTKYRGRRCCCCHVLPDALSLRISKMDHQIYNLYSPLLDISPLLAMSKYASNQGIGLTQGAHFCLWASIGSASSTTTILTRHV